jgi:phage tail protein X
VLRNGGRARPLAVAIRLLEGFMKQNERLLVYAVTGFLALILVVAVVFSREPAKNPAPGSAQGLDKLLGQDDGQAAAPAAMAKEKAELERLERDGVTGMPKPSDVTPAPLAAPAPKPLIAADLVAQQIGVSRRDRNVRFVRAKQNDTLEGLVRRWCGARDPYLDETKSLNEELVVLRVGQEVAVPWVEDDVLLAAFEAARPKTLLPLEAVAGGESAPGARQPATADARPSFAQPGAEPATTSRTAGGAEAGPEAGRPTAPRSPVAGGMPYTVKKGDALWSIAAKNYGRKNADRMVGEIKAANPGLSDAVREGQKIVLPKAPSGT